MTVKNLPGIRDVAERYEGYILDLWGVLHNGVSVFPGVPETIAEIKRAGRKVWLLSNAPRRAVDVAAQMDRMGLAPGAYDGILTSGELVYAHLTDKMDGKACLNIGTPDSAKIFEGLDIRLTDDPADADFVLASLSFRQESLPSLVNILEEARAHGLPLICANPDRRVHSGDILLGCAGALADIYESMGGHVEWFGKPYPAAYAMLREEMGTKNILAVGDSMTTDIAGAAGAGIDSALVVSGIHRDEWQDSAFFVKTPFRPTYRMERFAW